MSEIFRNMVTLPAIWRVTNAIKLTRKQRLAIKSIKVVNSAYGHSAEVTISSVSVFPELTKYILNGEYKLCIPMSSDCNKPTGTRLNKYRVRILVLTKDNDNETCIKRLTVI